MAKKKAETKKTNAEELARQAGMVAAKAERSATEAIERARALTTFLMDFFGKPIGAAVHAGQERFDKLSSGMSHLISGETSVSHEGTLDTVKEAIEARFRTLVHELGLPTRHEYEALKARLAELEKGAPKRPRKTAPAKKTSVTARPATARATKPRVRAAAKPAAEAPKPKRAPRAAKPKAQK